MKALHSTESLAKVSTSIPITRVFRVAFPFLLFCVAFIPRAIQQVETYDVWHIRGKDFIEAILNRNWDLTLQAPHPGVITMWLAGLTHKLGTIVNSDFGDLTQVQQMTVEVIPIALVISLTIVLAYFLLAKIFDWQVAAVATMLLALDPYHITLSKAIHVDALVSVFAMISALFLWTFVNDQRRRYLILSGAFAALALLTKTPAVFLLPYFFLVVGVWQLSKIIFVSEGFQLPKLQQLGNSTKIIIFAFGIWILAFVVVYFVLWPSMWSQPVETLKTTFGGADVFRRTPHPNPILLLGHSSYEDPGSLFYPVNMLVKTTSVTLIGFILSVVVLINRRLDREKRLALFMGLSFVFFFTLMMTLAEKKSSRYILPALQFAVLVAGVGYVYFFRWITKGRQPLLSLLLVLVIILQAAVSLPRHPYYGTHFNYLVGGPKFVLEREIVAGQEKAEGLEIAADYLNSLPLSPLMVVGAQNPQSFHLFFDGKTVPMTDEKVDYLVFARSWLTRGVRANQWRDLWEAYERRTPKLVVEFDNVPYVWVYKTGPVVSESDINHIVQANLGKNIQLLGYDIQPSKVQPGDSVKLTLYWQALAKTRADYTVFNHLLDSNGQLRGQQDSQPQEGMYPTYLWDEGERIIDEYEFTIPPDAPEGDYVFAVGMYELLTLERLPITTQSGDSVIDNQLLLPGPTVFKEQ